MKRTSVLAVASALSFLCLACRSTPTGPPEPLVPAAPDVEVRQFESTVITLEGIRFVGKVVIKNVMNGPLEIERVDYAADLHDRPIVEESFGKLLPMRSHGTQTVTLPIYVAMKDVVNQVEDVLAEESVRVTLRGTVYPVGFEPIPFTATKVVPAPRIPHVVFAGATGNPLDGEFTVRLRVENPNAFPLAFRSIESFLNLNGRRYDLLKSECFSHVSAGGSGSIALTMRQTRGKGLSMLVNVVKNQGAEFTVGGLIQCQTPHGMFHVPLEVGSSDAATPGR